MRLFICACMVFYMMGPRKVGAEEDQTNHLRFEYQFSLKGPYMTQPDQTVPFWNVLGDVVPGDEQVRLVPSIRDKKGLVWSKYPFPHDSWQIEVDLRIAGRGKVGADGLAIWYTSSPAEQGPVFGSKDFFNGVGIFLDSFDNDNRLNNPFVYVMLNDGTKSFDHASDGSEQQSGGCLRDFRNRPYPVKLKISYIQNKLEVYYSPGNLPDEEFHHLCTAVENVHLPQNGYFGVSAATGGLADDHDLLKFLTWSVSPKVADEASDDTLNSEERRKFQEEYDKNLVEFNKMQEEYNKENPDAAKTEHQSPEMLYEGHSSPELSAIFEVQSDIKREIRQLSESVQVILSGQTSLQSSISNMGTASEGGQVPAAGADDSAKKYHIDNVLNMQRETYDAVKELRQTLASLHGTVTNMHNKVQLQAENVGTGGVGDTYEALKQRQDIIQSLHTMQNDMTALLHRQPNTPKLTCPQPEMPSCVPLGVFIAVAIIQIVALIIYHTMKSQREDAAKKFF